MHPRGQWTVGIRISGKWYRTSWARTIRKKETAVEGWDLNNLFGGPRKSRDGSEYEERNLYLELDNALDHGYQLNGQKMWMAQPEWPDWPYRQLQPRTCIGVLQRRAEVNSTCWCQKDNIEGKEGPNYGPDHAPSPLRKSLETVVGKNLFIYVFYFILFYFIFFFYFISSP